MTTLHALHVRVRLAEHRQQRLQFKDSQKRDAAAVLALTARVSSEIEDLAQQLGDDDISQEDFADGVRSLLVAAGGDAAAIAGLDDDTLIADLVDGQAEYLPGFAQDVAGGLSDAMMAARAALWAGGVWSMYQSARGQSAKDDGSTTATWVLDPGASHCDSCLEYADASPYAIDDVPTPGIDTDCGPNCRCDIEFS